MRSRYDVYLNDIALSSLHTDLQVLDISYSAPNVKNVTYSLAKRDGLKLARRYVETASVTISFELHIYDTHKRQTALQDVNQWAAKGGILRTSDRQGQMLRCVCTNYPTINSAMRWNDALSITFTAFSYPYWQSITAATLTLTGTSASDTVYVDGSADGTYVEAQITANASLSSVTLTVGSYSITLSGLNIPANGVIRLTYDSDMIQSIVYGEASLLDKRTGADDLIAECNAYNTMSVTASASVTCVFTARGAWL